MSSPVYNETISIYVNLLKTSPTQRRALFDGLLTIGTNAYSISETQILSGGTYSGAQNTNALLVFCDQPVSITFNNGTASFTTNIQEIMILPGAISSWTISNNGINPANLYILSA